MFIDQSCVIRLNLLPYDVPYGMLVMVFRIPGCRSLKEKRGLIKPLLADLRKKFQCFRC